MLNHIGTQLITTNRLTLRRFTVEDSKYAFEKWTSSSDSQFWEPPHKNIEETKRMINEYVENYNAADWYMWAVVYEKELIGLVCGNEINEDIKSICIGYCITKSCWNKGIATEASKALIKYFFDIGFNRVFSYHNPLNPSSGRVMQKCGMTFEGRIRGGSMFAGEICDCLQYSILKSDIIELNFGGETMDKIKHILKTQFGVECTDIAEINGGLSALNYKVKTDAKTFFLKVYDKKKSGASLWTENINCYMPILIWLNENTKLQNRIVHPIKTYKSDYRFDDEVNVYLLFDYIDGETIGKTMTHAQILEIADIMACLHRYGNEIPVNTEKIKEDFSVPFCYSLERFIAKDYTTSPADVKAILQPCLGQLISINNEVMSLSEKVKSRNIKMVLCHKDAHGWNLIQGEHLFLVDWEGIKLAPAEADLIMFTKKEYWDTFIAHYNKLLPEFILDKDIFIFYILRRKIEDIWAFIEGVLLDNLSEQQRRRDLTLLTECCNSLDNLYFEL